MTTSAITKAREILLADPSRINTQQAALRLLQRHRKCSQDTAEYYMTELAAHQVFIEMFRELLPDDFKKLVGKVAGTDLAQKFFAALGFPLQDDLLEQLTIDGGNPMVYGIPIWSENDVANAEYEYLKPCWQLASLLYRPEGGWREDEGENLRRWEKLATQFGLKENLRPTGRAKFQIFQQVFEAQKTPLSFMPKALRILEYNTGTIFYDFDQDDETPQIDWTHGNIIWLREQYEIANQLGRGSRKLQNYLDEKQKARTAKRIATACRLYHRARIITHEENLRAVADPGKPLAGIL